MITVEDYRTLVSDCTRFLSVDPQTIEDIAQEALLKIHLYLASLPPENRQTSRRRELDNFIRHMTRNEVRDKLRRLQSRLKGVTVATDQIEEFPVYCDPFHDLSLKYAAQELLRILPEFEAGILGQLLNPSELFKKFYIRRQKIREFITEKTGRRYRVPDPLDPDDLTLAEFMSIAPDRYRRVIAKIRQVAQMLIARQNVRFVQKPNLKSREARINMMNEPQRIQNEPGCFGVLYDPLVRECRVDCGFRMNCKKEVQETIDRIGPDEFQKEFVRICGVNASDTSQEVLRMQEIFTGMGLEVIHNAQNVSARYAGKNIFVISKKKSKELANLVKIVCRAPGTLPPGIQEYLSPTPDGKGWVCRASTFETLETVLAGYLNFYRTAI